MWNGYDERDSDSSSEDNTPAVREASRVDTSRSRKPIKQESQASSSGQRSTRRCLGERVINNENLLRPEQPIMDPTLPSTSSSHPVVYNRDDVVPWVPLPLHIKQGVRPAVVFRTAGILSSGFIDTGACNSIASPFLASALKKKGFPAIAFPVSVILADGNCRMMTAEAITANVELQGVMITTKFISFHEAPHARTLLGSDFIKQSGLILNLKRNEFHFENRPWKWYPMVDVNFLVRTLGGHVERRLYKLVHIPTPYARRIKDELRFFLNFVLKTRIYQLREEPENPCPDEAANDVRLISYLTKRAANEGAEDDDTSLENNSDSAEESARNEPSSRNSNTANE